MIEILYIYIFEATLASCNLPVGDLRNNLVSKRHEIEIRIYSTLLVLKLYFCFGQEKKMSQFVLTFRHVRESD